MSSQSKRRKKPPRRKGPTPPNPARRQRAQEQTAPLPAGGDDLASPTRYTPPASRRGWFRPTWHKVVGSIVLLLGITVFIVNDLAYFDIEIMPGGHNELYALGAIVIAASSTWWFGLFDQPPGRW